MERCARSAGLGSSRCGHDRGGVGAGVSKLSDGAVAHALTINLNLQHRGGDGNVEAIDISLGQRHVGTLRAGLSQVLQS